MYVKFKDGDQQGPIFGPYSWFEDGGITLRGYRMAGGRIVLNEEIAAIDADGHFHVKGSDRTWPRPVFSLLE